MELAQILGGLGEFFGATAVVISLVFVVVSVRQNTHALRLNTLHDVKESIREINVIWSQNGELAEIMLEGFQNLDDLTGVRRVRFYTSMHNLFLGYENLFLQKQNGALAPEHWTGMAQHIIDVLSVPGLQAWWAERKHWFTDDFQVFIDQEVIPMGPNPAYTTMGT
jgi:hypothetical protein